MRTKLIDRELPHYTKGEEIFNSISHIVGGVIGIVALLSCVVISVKHENTIGIVSSAIYGFSMILLYIMSSIYHGLPKGTAKKVMQIIDHCSVYVLIAGTYTPISLCSLRNYNNVLGWSFFGVEWGFAILSIILNAIDLKKFFVFSMICNIVMGWGLIFILPIAIKVLTNDGFMIVLLGGIFYTVGAILYGIGVKKSYMHCVFHIFVILGSVAHLYAIMFYVL